MAYDIFCNKEKYRKIGNEFTVIKKDAFYYATIGDLDKLKCLIENNKNLLYEKDKLQRNLLYLHWEIFPYPNINLFDYY